MHRASLLMKMENRKTPKEKYLHDFKYHGKELSFTEAKNIMFQYLDSGGFVDLEKDFNGIAKIRLSNPRFKNAINGVFMHRASLLMKMENGKTPKEKYLHDFKYHGKELSFTEAKNIMFQCLDSGGFVDLEKDFNGIAKIRLSNPRFKNAINVKMMSDLEEITEKLSQWTDCKGAIVYGADGNFCSGGDLNTAKKINNPYYGYAMNIYLGHILDKFKRLPIITVAYIEGAGAIGGGAEITTACDYRLMCNASDSTAIGFTHSKMGIVPAWGSTGRLVSIVGVRKTLDLLLESRMLRTAEAMESGLVNGAVATMADAEAWLSRKIKADLSVIRAIKSTVMCYDDSREIVRMMESRIFAPLWGGTVHNAALEQHLKYIKRNPGDMKD